MVPWNVTLFGNMISADAVSSMRIYWIGWTPNPI